jgi:hypothetical protein
VSEDTASEDTDPLRRVLDVFVFAPVGLALTALEDLPGLVTKGRERVETEISNARVVGEFVVQQGQREISERLGQLLNRSTPESAPAEAPDAPPDETPAPTTTAAAAAPKPEADPADAIIVEQALDGYDTLSASQVVRRLESLGPEELRAVHRYEASHRNRRTILNRTQQLLATE